MASTTVTVGTRPKHPFGRRNTFIHPYVRHGLGYATAEWQKNLTVKFRDLPSRERRLGTMSLGYGLRDDKGDPQGKRARETEMTRDHAIALMARFHEMLLHGGRTVGGVFAALGIDTRYGCFRRQYVSIVVLH